jgi:hypothetical protein
MSQPRKKRKVRKLGENHQIEVRYFKKTYSELQQMCKLKIRKELFKNMSFFEHERWFKDNLESVVATPDDFFFQLPKGKLKKYIRNKYNVENIKTLALLHFSHATLTKYNSYNNRTMLLNAVVDVLMFKNHVFDLEKREIEQSNVLDMLPNKLGLYMCGVWVPGNVVREIISFVGVYNNFIMFNCVSLVCQPFYLQLLKNFYKITITRNNVYKIPNYVISNDKRVNIAVIPQFNHGCWENKGICTEMSHYVYKQIHGSVENLRVNSKKFIGLLSTVDDPFEKVTVLNCDSCFYDTPRIKVMFPNLNCLKISTVFTNRVYYVKKLYCESVSFLLGVTKLCSTVETLKVPFTQITIFSALNIKEWLPTLKKMKIIVREISPEFFKRCITLLALYFKGIKIEQHFDSHKTLVNLLDEIKYHVPNNCKIKCKHHHTKRFEPNIRVLRMFTVNGSFPPNTGKWYPIKDKWACLYKKRVKITYLGDEIKTSVVLKRQNI